MSPENATLGGTQLSPLARRATVTVFRDAVAISNVHGRFCQTTLIARAHQRLLGSMRLCLLTGRATATVHTLPGSHSVSFVWTGEVHLETFNRMLEAAYRVAAD